MKKVILFAMLCIFGALEINAQSGLTADQLKFRNGIEQFLKEEGFFTTIDDDDNSVNWKKEGARYWITVEDSDPFYIEFHRAGFSLDGEDRDALIRAANYANLNKRCGKACVGQSSIAFTVEFYCNSISEFRNIFYRSMRAIDATREATVDYYNEHK